MTATVVSLRRHETLLSKKQLAAELGRSPRWVERLYGHPRDDPARDRLKMAFAERESELRRRKGFAG